ncbi:MAG: hypothetical protein ACI8RA_001131 [Chlamydiales bacterium]|jgi:hypothetical protein
MFIKFIPSCLFFLILLMCFFASNILEVEWTLQTAAYYTLFSFAIAAFTSMTTRQFITILKTRGCSPRILFRNFNEKIWMTALLGVFFALVFLSFSLFTHYFLDKSIIKEYFYFGLKNPGLFFFWAAAIFGLNSLFIILVRTILKFIYLSHKY